MKKCQFFIILGSNKYVSSDIYKVCINISDDELYNYDIIKKRLFDLYNEKSNNGLVVNNEIIFLLSDNKYREVASKIMNQIGLNGRIMVIPSNINSNVNTASEEKKEEVIVKPKEDSKVVDLNAYRERVLNNNSVVGSSNSMVNTGENNVISTSANRGNEDSPINVSVTNENKNSASNKKYSYRPDTMVFYKKDLNPNGEGGTPLTRGEGGVSLTNGKKSVNIGKVKSLKKNSNRAAFVSFPVLMFVVSLLLLIASFVILFVLD